MKTVLKNSRHNHAGIYSSPETFSKGDDIKLKEIQSFSPHSFIFLSLLSFLFFSFGWLGGCL